MVEFVSIGWWAFFFRWLHIASGVMWIGHLWYFNFTQTPTMPKIPQELRPGVVRYILPEALFWFRWGAMLTIITGLIVAWLRGIIGPALGLGIGHRPGGDQQDSGRGSQDRGRRLSPSHTHRLRCRHQRGRQSGPGPGE